MKSTQKPRLTKKAAAKRNLTKQTNPTSTIGGPGAIVVGGFLESDETNASLTNGNQYKTYSNLLANVSIVSAGVRYFLNLVSKATWKVTASDDSDEAERFAAIIRTQLTRMETPWARIVRRAAMYRFYGFSIQEWTMEIADNIYQYADIAPRPQQTIEQWSTDKFGKVTGVSQRIPATQELKLLPRDKILYLVDDSLNDSPEGLGLFRHIVESCARLQRYEQLEGYGFESDLRGIPVGKAPFAALQEAVDTGFIEKKDMEDATDSLTTFISNHIKNPALGILLDSATYEDDEGRPSGESQWGLDLLKGGSSALPDMAVAIERVNREIARTLGVEGLLLGEQTSGSHALSKDKSLNFALIVDSTLSEIKDTYQRDFIKRLFEVNGWDMQLMPIFDTEALQHRDITQITQALKDMAAAGALLDLNDPATNEVRAMLGLTKQPEVDPAVAALRQSTNSMASTSSGTQQSNSGDNNSGAE